jgi:hypothetical protein
MSISSIAPPPLVQSRSCASDEEVRRGISQGTDDTMSWLLMAAMTADEREQYVDAVLLDGGFPMHTAPPAPDEPEAVR